MAKQNPETGAPLLRKLSRAQLQLWQEIGRKGQTLSDLAIRHVGRDMLSEVRVLEEQGVIVLQELATDDARQAFSAKSLVAEPAPEDEVDKRVRRHTNAPKRKRRSSAAIEKSNLEPRPRGRPTGPMRPQDLGDETKEASPIAANRHKRPTAAVEKRSRRKSPKAAQAHAEPLSERPAAPAKRPRRPTAAIEKPVRQRKKKRKPTLAPAELGASSGRRPRLETEIPIDFGNALDSEEVAEAAPSMELEAPNDLGGGIDLGAPNELVPAEGLGGGIDLGGSIELGASLALGPPIELGASGLQGSTDAKPSLEKWAENASGTLGRETPKLSSDSIGEWGPRGTNAATKPAMPNPLGARSKQGASTPLSGNRAKRPSQSIPSVSFRDAGSLHGGAQAVGDGQALELGGDGLTLEESELMKLDIDLNQKEKRRVIDVARAVKSGDICGLLGLPNTAKRKEVKRAYFALSQELHPDQYFGRKLGGFKPLLEQAFTSLAQYVKALNDKRTTLPNSYRTSNNARRKSQRFHLSLRAQVQCDSWSGPEWTTTQDISSGGAFLVTDVEAVLGESIRLNVESPNGTIGIAGVVVSRREADQARRERRNSGIGIQFQKAAELDSQRLAELLAEAKSKTPAFTASVPIKSLAAQKLAKSSKAKGRQKHIIGIDLGTTNTAVSAIIDNRVQIIPWPDGTYSVPSVVAFPERRRCVVGYEAQKHLLSNPRNAVNSAKRLMGRQFDDPEIASYMSEARFKNFKGPDGTVIAQLQGEDYAIPQICSYLFTAAKHAAATALGAEPTQTVLTVPVSYDQGQVEAMRLAAKLAQLDVIEIIEEPCAAAIANQGQRDFKGIVGVYDFGGGTFDFSLVEAGAGDLRVLATTGDSWLGGDDFDLAIADAAADMFWKAEGTDLRQKAVEWQHLVFACEKAKRDLSIQDHAQVLVPEVARNAQGTVDLRINLSREKVELLWAEPIRRSIDTCKQALSLAGISMDKLSAIYMSGGTSYIPAIRRSLMKSFGVPVHLGLAPEHAVCAGAGIRAAVLQGQ